MTCNVTDFYVMSWDDWRLPLVTRQGLNRYYTLNLKVGKNDEDADVVLPGAPYNSFSCRVLGALPGCQSRCNIGGVPVYVAAVTTVVHPAVVYQDARRQMWMLNHKKTCCRRAQVEGMMDCVLSAVQSLLLSVNLSWCALWAWASRPAASASRCPNVPLSWILSIRPLCSQYLMEDTVPWCR